MNLSIKDLEIAQDLSCEEQAAVRGGANGISTVDTTMLFQVVNVPTVAAAGAGSAQNVDIDVNATQNVSKHMDNNIGDAFILKFGRPLMF